MDTLRIIYPITIRHQYGYIYVPGDDWITPLREEFEFTIRCITRSEFQCWNSNLNQSEFENTILSSAVLSHPEMFRGKPWNWDNVYAGVVERLKQEILKVSGFLGEPHPELIGRVDTYLQSREAKFDLIIMMAFPQYKLEDLMNTDNETWHKISGMAQSRFQLEGLDIDAILDPEKFQKKVEMAQKQAEVEALQRRRGRRAQRWTESE